MKASLLASAIVLLAGQAAFAHRLDEYLQGAIVSVDKNRAQVELTLTPGAAVFPFVLVGIDTDGNGLISEAEQRAYVERVLGDLSMEVDGYPLTPRLVSVQFPAIAVMKDGLGEIRIVFSADLPPGGSRRRFILDNRHQSRIAAYQVNCLVPDDPDIRVVAQNRNYSQSQYELEYLQAGVRSSLTWPVSSAWLVAAAVVLLARFAFICRRTRRVGGVTVTASQDIASASRAPYSA